MQKKVGKEWKFWFDYADNLPRRHKRTGQTTKSYYFILDCFTNEFLFISPKAKDVLGQDYKLYTIADFINSIHPDDKDDVINYERFAIEFMESLFYNEHFRYHISYSYRVMTAFGYYIRIKQTYHALDVNEEGHMSQSIILHEVIEGDYEKDNYDFLVFDRLKFRRVNLDNIFDLTKREKQVLDLILNAKTSQEISEILFLSLHTVNTHRKHILAKTNSSNFLELIQKMTQRKK